MVYGLKPQRLVGKIWCDKSSATITLKCNIETFTQALPKNHKTEGICFLTATQTYIPCYGSFYSLSHTVWTC